MKTKRQNKISSNTMLADEKPTVHLIGGILKTICGRKLEEVEWAIDVNVCTCKSCLKQKNTNYPTLEIWKNKNKKYGYRLIGRKGR